MKKQKRFCLLALGLAVSLLAALLPTEAETVRASEWNNAYTYYNAYENRVLFRATSSTNGNIYYATKAATGSTSTRYRTIGWKLTVYGKSNKKLQTLYFKLGGSYMNKVHSCKKSGKEYCLYSFTLNQLRNRLNSKAETAVNDGQAEFVLDACMVVVKNGKAKGTMNDSGPVSGNVYTTYSGISGAAKWSSASYSSFYNYFDKEIEGLFYRVIAREGDGIKSTSGSGNYCYGSNVTLNAKPRAGYAFEMWDGDVRTGNAKYSFYVNEDVTCTAYALRKKLEIVMHRNLTAKDTVWIRQIATYADAGSNLDSVGWTADGKKLAGWAFRADSATCDIPLRANIPEAWIDKYEPHLDLYAVWENVSDDKKTDENTSKREDTQTDPGTSDTPTPTPSVTPKDDPKVTPSAGTDPEEEDGTDDPALPSDTPTVVTKRKIHCRFISGTYFEDGNQNLIPKERGGLAADSRWAQDTALRIWLRQLLCT